MVVLPDAELDAAIRVASRIARQLAEQKLKHAKSPIGDFVTLSMGVAGVVPTAAQMEKTLVEMTDIALYKAKNAAGICLNVLKNQIFVVADALLK